MRNLLSPLHYPRCSSTSTSVRSHDRAVGEGTADVDADEVGHRRYISRGRLILVHAQGERAL
jgi:hypothetical protein